MDVRSRPSLRGAVGGLSFQLDGVPGLVPVDELLSHLRGCLSCGAGLNVVVREGDSKLEISCRGCLRSWLVLRTGKIIGGRDDSRFFTPAFSAHKRGDPSSLTVEERPLTFEDVLGLREWAAAQ